MSEDILLGPLLQSQLLSMQSRSPHTHFTDDHTQAWGRSL